MYYALYNHQSFSLIVFTLCYAAETFFVHSSVMRQMQAGTRRFCEIPISHTCTICTDTQTQPPCTYNRDTHTCMHVCYSSVKTHALHIHTQMLWVSDLWQPVISLNPFIMFLFSFPLFGEKGECKQEFRYTKKNTQPQAEKTRAGNFWEKEGHLCAEGTHVCIAIWHEKERLHCSCDCVLYINVCVLAVLSLTHADQWEQGSALCRSLGSLRSNSLQ